MAWKWPGSSTSGRGEEWTGFIDQGVTMEGTLQVTGTFRVDGNVKGNIISEQTLILGENAKALDTLDQAYAGRSIMLPLLKTEPAFAALHAEPRFQGLAQKLALP